MKRHEQIDACIERLEKLLDQNLIFALDIIDAINGGESEYTYEYVVQKLITMLRHDETLLDNVRNADESARELRETIDRMREAYHEQGARAYVLDKHLKLIRIGDTVYGEDGKAWKVKALSPGEPYEVWATNNGEMKVLKGDWLTHERSDTWDSIIQDTIEAVQGGFDEGIVPFLVDRCKKLAGEVE